MRAMQTYRIYYSLKGSPETAKELYICTSLPVHQWKTPRDYFIGISSSDSDANAMTVSQFSDFLVNEGNNILCVYSVKESDNTQIINEIKMYQNKINQLIDQLK